jgi:hypothetical protein
MPGVLLSGLTLPVSVNTPALPLGIVQSIPCSAFDSSAGKGTISVEAPGTAATLGYTLTATYTACSISGITYNGTYQNVYTRFTAGNDFSSVGTYKNFMITGSGQATQTLNGKSICNSTPQEPYNCYYSEGNRGWASDASLNSGNATGTFVVGYGSGTLRFAMARITSTGGSATVTGANGSKAVITRNSATSFTVAIATSSGGASTGYTVTR